MQAHYITVLELYFAGNTKHNYVEVHQNIVEELKRSLKERRDRFYALAKISWETIKKGEVLTDALVDEIAVAMKQVVVEGRDDVVKTLPYTGIFGVRETETLNRIVRDILTATQHSLFL